MFLLKSPTLAHATVANKRDQTRSGSLRRLEETPRNEAGGFCDGHHIHSCGERGLVTPVLDPGRIGAWGHLLIG